MTNHQEEAGHRIWFDTEFIEDGRTIELVSIGMVREDGVTYYAECAEADLSRGDEWMEKNVYPHLTGETKPRAQIAAEIISFVGQKPEFWAYYADYDWVALCQLYGRMIDLPKGWPMFCRDLKQKCVDLLNPQLPKQTGAEHNALADAQWNLQVWDFLTTLAPADNGLVERYGFRDDKFVAIKKGSYVSFSDYEALQADRAAQAAEIAGLREGEARLSLLLNERAQELSEAGSEIERLKAEWDCAWHHTSNLLARIHRDGGHYETEHGTSKAVEDADAIIARLYADEPRTAALEALLDKAVEALEPFAGISDLIDAETEGMSETDELELHYYNYLMASWQISLFRSALTAIQEARHVTE